jgi:hypothetical protein
MYGTTRNEVVHPYIGIYQEDRKDGKKLKRKGCGKKAVETFCPLTCY